MFFLSKSYRHFILFFLFFSMILFFVLPAPARSKAATKQKYDTQLFNALQWRCIGPFRGGRSVAVAGHKNLQFTYYFGATGGGVWKTEDGGMSWFNVSDSAFQWGSVGAIAVAESDPNVVYAGHGSLPDQGLLV